MLPCQFVTIQRWVASNAKGYENWLQWWRCILYIALSSMILVIPKDCRCNYKLQKSVLILSLQFNFVGKLLGPKGNSLKRLQEDTMCKMSVLGRGSMRDRKKVSNLIMNCRKWRCDLGFNQGCCIWSFKSAIYWMLMQFSIQQYPLLCSLSNFKFSKPRKLY